MAHRFNSLTAYSENGSMCGHLAFSAQTLDVSLTDQGDVLVDLKSSNVFSTMLFPHCTRFEMNQLPPDTKKSIRATIGQNATGPKVKILFNNHGWFAIRAPYVQTGRSMDQIYWRGIGEFSDVCMYWDDRGALERSLAQFNCEVITIAPDKDFYRD